MLLVLGVGSHHPLVEGKYPLDVPLTNTATGRELRHILIQPNKIELVEGIISHQILAGHYQLCQACNLQQAKKCHSTNFTHSYIYSSTHLCIGHISVEHFHLGIDIVSLLVLIQGAIVPHQEVEGWVELPNVVRTPYPGLFLTNVGSKAVAAVWIACSHNEDIVWNGL